MLNAVPASATGHFHERPVVPGLHDSFAAIWIHKMPEAAVPPIVITPDGTIDLQWIEGDLRVAGPDKWPQTETVPAGATVIGFRFRPAAAAAWLKVPVNELTGQRLPLQELWGPKARSVASKIRSQKGISDVVTMLEATLAECAPNRPVDGTMRAAYRLIEAGAPPDAPLLPWLARSLAMSERTLRRRFEVSFGYGPKTMDRILRYQRFLRLSRTSPSPTAVVAVEAGYADQAHLVRESRRLSRFTPKELSRSPLMDQS